MSDKYRIVLTCYDANLKAKPYADCAVRLFDSRDGAIDFALALAQSECENLNDGFEGARLKFLDGALEEDKKRKLLFLIDSITNITGPITDAKHLYISGGDLNGVVMGEKGVAKIQTFSAGGYNIQCFHWRTRVDDVTEKYAVKTDLDDVIKSCEEISRDNDARSEKSSIDKDMGR